MRRSLRRIIPLTLLGWSCILGTVWFLVLVAWALIKLFPGETT
jgi:hypothetical protein